MAEFSVNVLWATSILLPSLLFAVANPLKSTLVTALRALLAIASGWAYILAYAIAAQSITAPSAGQINGAALAFASVFGWVEPTVMVAITWASLRLATKYRRAAHAP